MPLATGPFTVTMTQLPPDPAEPAINRTTIAKVLEGDLAATSTIQMLSFMSPVTGSAGYVAIEKVTGTLHGRRGSFVLQHSGTMNRGAPALSVTVVPDSGTEGLTGLAGSMRIIIEGGKHSYEFEYTIAG